MFGGVKLHNFTKSRHKTAISQNAKNYLHALVFFYIALGAINMLQGVYIKELKIGEDFLGLLISTKTLAIALSAFPCAIIVNKIGKKRSIVTSMLLVTICIILQGVFTNKWLILILSVFQGASNALLAVTEAPFLMENSKNELRIKLFSFAYAVNNFSVMIGYYMFGSITEALTKKMNIISAYRVSIIASGFIGLISVIFALMIKENTEKAEVLRHVGIKESIKVFNEKGVRQFLIFNFIIGFGAGLVVPYFNVYLKFKININTNQMGIIMSLSQLGMGFGGLITPILAKKYGKVKTINLCQASSIPFLLMIAVPSYITVVAVAFFMRSALMNMAGPVINNMSMEIVKSEQRPLLSSLMNLSSNLSRAISAAIAGVIMKELGSIGYEIPYYITTILYIIGIIYFHNNFKNYDKKYIKVSL